MQTKDLLLALRSGRIGLDEARNLLASGPAAPGTAPEAGTRPETVAPAQVPARQAVAVIGMSGRYPGAENLDRYWENLRAGRSTVTEVPAGRWDVDAHYDPQSRRPGRTDCRWIGALSDFDAFDPAFFGIPQAEAHATDPQHRLFLQEAFHAFEDAGYGRERLDGRACGVYLGLASHEYGDLLSRHAPDAGNATGTNGAIAAARIAYHLNLTGPAMSVDAACTSSLVAVHLACQALRAGETDLALAGGVSLYLGADRYVSMSAAGMLSPTGQCRPFDSRADGFVPGEGVGALVLKRLDDAERDGDPVHGVIVATAVNQNGSTNGITAPGRRSQAALMRQLYAARDIDPADIGHIEAHATGTTMGDFIELDALNTVFRERTDKREFCAVGSVKGNIGHGTAAAGVAGLHKTLLSLRHRTLVPTLHVEEPNPHFDFPSSPFYLNTRTRPWDAPDGRPRLGCVSAFGFSGSNAHIVLEEYTAAPTPPTGSARGGGHLFVLSAKTPDALARQAAGLHRHLLDTPGADLAATAWTLQTGREAMDVRAAFVAASREELLGALDGHVRTYEAALTSSSSAGEPRRVPASHRRRWPARTALPELPELAAAWLQGVDLTADEWALLHDGTPRRVHLPGYPFAEDTYWYTALAPAAEPVPAPELASAPEPAPGGESLHFRSQDPYVRDHTVAGVPTLIGMTHAGLALDWFFDRFPQHDAARLSRLTFLRTVELPDGTRAEIRLEPDDTPSREDLHVRAVYRKDAREPWTPAAECRIRGAAYEPERADRVAGLPPVDPERLYGRNPAIEIGETFRTFAELYADGSTVVAAVDITGDGTRGHSLDPLLMYSAFQAALLFLDEDGSTGYLPFGVEEVRARRAAVRGRVWLTVRLRRDSGELVVFDADLTDDAGEVVARLSACSMKRVRPAAPPVVPVVTTQDDLPEAIRRYLAGKVAALLDDPGQEVDPRINLMDLGVTSEQLVSLTADIERDNGLELSPALFFEYPSLDQLADHFLRDHRDVFASGPGGGWPAVGAAPVPASGPAPTPAPVLPARAEADRAGHEDIAVIGMHGMLPGAADLDEFWQNLVARKDVISEIPPDHWDYRPWFDATPGARDKTYCKWGGFLEDVDTFDAEFFGISPREAEWMDPQLRLLLQSVYATAEDAGAAARLRGSDTGVFIGVCCHDYLDADQRAAAARRAVRRSRATTTRSSPTGSPSRFDLKRPERGSRHRVLLVAGGAAPGLPGAAQRRVRHCARRRGEPAAVAVPLPLLQQRGRMLSPTGRCQTFDEAADGYVPGEGFGVVLLKPLAEPSRTATGSTR